VNVYYVVKSIAGKYKRYSEVMMLRRYTNAFIIIIRMENDRGVCSHGPDCAVGF